MNQATIDSAGAGRGSLKSYLTGFVLSLILTAIPFALVMSRALVRVGHPGSHSHRRPGSDFDAPALLPASGHFISGTLERAGLDIHHIDHGPLRRRKPLDHVYPELPNDVRMPETIKK